MRKPGTGVIRSVLLSFAGLTLSACMVDNAPSRAFEGPGLLVSKRTVALDAEVVPLVEECADGAAVRRTSDGWQCAPLRADSVLDEASVDAMLDDNGYAVGTRLAALESDVVGARDSSLDLHARITELEQRLAAIDTGPVNTEVSDARGVEASLADQIAELEADLAAIDEDARDCPSLYVRDPSVTEHVVCKRGLDEIVKVGNFWVDRYESSVWLNSNCSGMQFGTSSDDYPGSFPDSGNWTQPAYACAVPGVTPSRYLTWFQAQQACLLVGKHLASNSEWQAAAADTAIEECNTGATGVQGYDGQDPEVAGSTAGPGGTGCVSTHGAFDMVGNVSEWTDDWSATGIMWQSTDGEVAMPWPSYADGDATRNFNSRPTVNGRPSVYHRGGWYLDAAWAGVFFISGTVGPAGAQSVTGFRCALSG